MTRTLGKQALKAYMAAVAALLAALGNGYSDGVLGQDETLGALSAALVAFAAVYFIPNGTSQDPTTSTPEV